MYQPLAPCASCRRHVRATEAQCPFCGGALGAVGRSLPESRIARASMAVFALAIAGCTEPTAPTTNEPITKPADQKPTAKPSETVAEQADAAPIAKPTLDAGEVDDHGSVSSKYGAAPMPKPFPPTPHPIAVPAYGGPPPKPTPPK